MTAAATTNHKPQTKNPLGWFLSEYLVLGLTVLLFLALAPFTPGLATSNNLLNILGYLLPLLIVAIAENGRIPVDNTAAPLELSMIHEALVLEYSGRNLALLEAAQMLKLLVFVSLVTSLFAPWGLAAAEEGLDLAELAIGLAVFVLHLALAAVVLAIFEVCIAKMRVFRVVEFLGAALILALLAVMFRFVSDIS